MYYAPGNEFYAINRFTSEVVNFQYNHKLINAVNPCGSEPLASTWNVAMSLYGGR